MKLKATTATYITNKLSNDQFVMDENNGLFILAHATANNQSNWASTTVCNEIKAHILAHQKTILDVYHQDIQKGRNKAAGVIEQAIQLASKKIFDTKKKDPTLHDLAVAIVVTFVLNDCAVVVSTGNCRAYLTRDRNAIQITKDHTLFQDMVDSKKWPPGQINPAFKKRLTRALGLEESLVLVSRAVPLTDKDMILLCTSGLSNQLPDKSTEISTLFSQAASIEQVPAHLSNYLSTAKQSTDNATVIAIAVMDNEDKQESDFVGEREKLTRLSKVPIFRSIKDSIDDLIKISSILTTKHVKAGDKIVKQGDPSDEMFILIKGKVHILKNEQKVAEIKQGGVIGEIGFFNKKNRNATVSAAEDCHLLVLHQKDFSQLLLEDKDLIVNLAFGIIADLSEKVDLGSENLANLQIKNRKISN